MGSYNYYKMFGFLNRKFKISEREPPPDVRDAFSLYAGNGPHMNAEQLARFMVEYQGEEGRTADDAAEIIQQIHDRRQHLAKHNHLYLDLDGFFEFLFQDDLNGPLNTQVSNDMTAPLQHYFIYTGHNSYLTGNQLSSRCSEKPIIKALERGVRGIELDLWPNSAKDNIHVLHGRTLTTPVTFYKCLESIKKHAFVKSPYPVIITLEDHLTPDLQAKAAEMLSEVFGEMLYYPESGCLEELPSPEELKYRILLSTKAPKEYLESRQQSEKETPASPSGKDSSEDDSSIKEKTENAAAEENEAEGRQVNSDPDGGCSQASTSQPGGTECNAEQQDRVEAEKANASEAEKTNAEQQDRGEAEKIDAEQQDRVEAEKANASEAEKTNAEQQDRGEAKKTNAEQQDRGEAKKTNAEQQDRGEAKKTNAEQQGRGEAKKTNAEQQDCGEAEKTDAENQDCGEAEKTNAGQQDCGEAEKTDAENQVRGEAEKTDAEQQDRAEAEKTDAEQQDRAEAEKTDAEAEKTDAEPQDSDRGKNDLGNEGGDASTQSALRSGPEYKRLIAIRAGKAKQGMKHALTTVQERVKRLSVNEGDLEKAAVSYGTDVVSFTQKSILRVFPKGTRVTSSNFKPMLGWMHGAQMVAFNMQGYGKSLWLMHGMFRANGGCGYVKKPRFLIERGPEDEVFDPKVTVPLKFTLKVTVYLGDGWSLDFSHTHFDAFSPPDFYTKLFIVGAPADCAKRKTRIIEDDWGPIWGEEFEFPLTVPELALLRIEVREYDMSEKDDFGGQTCLPVSELRPGIRSVPLHDKKGEKYKSVRLLMRFQFM
ncbi:phosphoinositide phospholipase C 6-like [Ipomoea triloba]|uniref:phosphoinositide phospholipase C 6-like n=1 Tax=Ipomoea triloba TaxID=35885 RepID=UPI00125D073E|nr:phosphoinositide phospholipase C 6-like [Ipomoea triloba]